jgi:stage II sporulation protein Q
MVAEVMKMKEENKNSSNQQSNWQKYAKKRWFYPTVYIVVAALVITVAFWMQGDQQAKIESGEYDLDQYVKYPSDEDYGVTPVTNTTELVGWPVTDSSVVTVFTPFYDPQGTEQEQEAAIVVYNNIYYQNKGIDLVMQNGEAFDVVAAMSGTVTRVDNDPQLGFVIEIEHDNNIVTHYHSLSTANVAAGDVVTKGMLLGKAGQNVYNQEAGNHVHFEIRYNDGSHMVAVNPIDYFNQPITSIPKKKSDEEDGDNGNENGDQEGNQQENENPEDNDTPNSTT